MPKLAFYCLVLSAIMSPLARAQREHYTTRPSFIVFFVDDLGYGDLGCFGHPTKNGYGRDPIVEHDPPLLYNLMHDPSETRNIAKANPDVLLAIKNLVTRHRASVRPVPNQLHQPPR